MENDEKKADADAFDGWSHLPRFAGGTALMFGGIPCHKSAETIRRGLRLADLDWVDGGKTRVVESTVERVAGGFYSSVFINKFGSHTDIDRIIEACKRAGIPYAVLRHGFGAHAVRSAVERSLGER